MTGLSEEQVERPTELGFGEMVPAEWREGENSWLWVSCYHVMRVPKSLLAEGPRRIQMADSFVLLFYGTHTYLSQPNVTVQSTDVPRFLHSPLEPTAALEGAYLLLILRHYPPGESDFAVQVREVTLRALLGTVFGENIVYSRLFGNAFRVDQPSFAAAGPTIRNPFTWPVPNISDERLNLARELSSAVEGLEEHTRNRVKLSLRWHGEARDSGGIEAFIKQWVALEALGMAQTSNIAPLNDLLAEIYGCSLEEARERFQVGRVFGLRSKILHQGLMPSIEGALLDYLRALYKDLLWHRLGFPSEFAAKEELETAEFDLTRLLRAEKST